MGIQCIGKRSPMLLLRVTTVKDNQMGNDANQTILHEYPSVAFHLKIYNHVLVTLQYFRTSGSNHSCLYNCSYEAEG
ncbi:hypothetical protein CEXT_745801 [Caerostris extrusa]|uniref:Uncharacterized protein n=1 Tax=Caerostris extrusa TaxID=172846 RepID=A0AAV4THQ9_CAEEX|nr:hypothetical protein CEXT_745801 [Caerostris extrusa]